MSKKVKKAQYETEKVTVEVSMVLVESSQIKSIGHLPEDNATQLKLFVRFHSGGLYVYRKVPAALVQDFIAAESSGSFLNQNIKGKFEYEKIA